jgi:hypothetical protein
VFRKLVLTVGPWAPALFGSDIPLSLHVERRALFWFKPDNDKLDDFRVSKNTTTFI